MYMYIYSSIGNVYLYMLLQVYDTDTGDGVQHISVPTISVTGNDDRSSSEAVKSRNDPSVRI